MEETAKKRTSSTKIIIIVIAVLALLTGILAAINLGKSGERRELLEAAEIRVMKGDTQAGIITMETVEALPSQDFSANLKSTGNDPVEHTYTGVPLSAVLKEAGISLGDSQRVLAVSADGYTVPMDREEVEKEDNIYLVYQDNGEYLGSLDDKDGQGPYMIVIRDDAFSQRWGKYVVELELE